MRGQKRSFDIHEAGFTLLEVLVALVLLSVALVVILQLFSANLRGIAASEDLAKATMRAEASMRDVLDDEDIAEKSSSETTPDGYRTDVAITKVDEKKTENLPLELLQISLKVHWKDGVKERSLTLKTMKAVTKKV
jgi:general secretion pathway protein I